MKTILHKRVGTRVLFVEEFYSILADVEAVLNSLPLVPMDGAQTDGVQVLTPGHFLVGRPLTALPSPNLSNCKMSTLRIRWNLCQCHTADIWEKWSRDYIQQLQRYSKWAHPQRTVRVGDIVLLKDTELFVRSWPLARVIEVHPGKDGQVRVIEDRNGYLQVCSQLSRPIDRGRGSGIFCWPGGCSGFGSLSTWNVATPPLCRLGTELYHH